MPQVQPRYAANISQRQEPVVFEVWAPCDCEAETEGHVGQPMKDLIEAIAKGLVEHPDQVSVRVVEGE
jgi:hypothetical protein